MNSPAEAVSTVALLRLRPDVQATPIRRGLERRWVLKNAFTLEHFEATDDEWFLLQELDGRTSPKDLVGSYNKRFSPRRLSESALLGFLHTACRFGVAEPVGGEPGRAREAQRQTAHQAIQQGVQYAFAPRFSLFNPVGLLDGLGPVGLLIFNRAFALVMFFVAALLIFLAIGRANDILAAGGSFELLASSGQIVSLALIWWCVKAAHEIGHGLACRRFGAECTDIGVFLFAGFPVLYCDVTDAWTIPDRWRRAMIAAAGVYVELLLATAAGALWLALEPGLLRSLLGQVVLVCGASTLLFNANPLLRLDGYYVLSDLTGISNLQEQSRAALWAPIQRWLSRGRLGVRQEATRTWVSLYGALSSVYRVLVVALTCWLIWGLLKPFGLQLLAIAFSAVASGMLLAPLATVAHSILRRPDRGRIYSAKRAWLLVGLVVAGLGVLLGMPSPGSVLAPGMVVYPRSQALFAPSAGRFVTAVRYGDRVTAGQVLGRIEDPGLTLEIAEAEALVAEIELEMRQLKKEQTYSDRLVASRIESLTARRQAKSNELAELQSEAATLVLRADRDGLVCEPDQVRRHAVADELAPWSGFAMSHENDACWLVAGDPIALIGEPTEAEALLLVEQGDLGLIETGAATRLRFAEAPSVTGSGTVTRLGRRRVESPPDVLLASSLVPTQASTGGETKPASSHYYVAVSIESPPLLMHGSPVRVRVEADQGSLGGWLLRQLCRVFYTAS